MTAKANATRYDLKTHIEHLGFRLVRALVRALPVDLASRLGAFAWRWLAPLNKRHRRAERQLALAYPDSDPRWRARTLRGMWSNLGSTFAESFVLDRLIAMPERFRLIVAPEVEAAIADERHGLVLASLHSGNWEVAVAPLVWRGLSPSGIYQKVRNPLVDADVQASRAALYPAGLMPKGASTARRAIKTVKGGGIVSVMADLRDRRGMAIPFFGRTAPSTPFPAMLARTTGAPIIAGRVIREGPAQFAIEARRIDVPRTDDREADIASATRDLHACFEAWIRERPEQWMWGHRRWGTVAVRTERSAAVIDVAS